MRRLLILGIVLAGVGTVLLFGQGKGQGKGKGKDKDPAGAAQVQGTGAEVNLSLRFGGDEGRLIREYYTPRMSQLPPGLQKKVARGGALPPGWQKKVQGFPADLDRRLPPLPSGYRRVLSGSAAWLVHDATNLLIDVLELK